MTFPKIALCALLSLCAAKALAITPQDLPPVDDVFQISASADQAGQADFDFSIREGFYLYRHQFDIKSDDFSIAQVTIPPGAPYRDEFFGDVETYRNAVRISAQGKAGSSPSTFKVKYQGCADLGVCYPPQVRSFTINVPATAAAKFELGSKAPARFGNAQITTGQELPLPEEQAYQVSAMVADANQILLRIVPEPGYYFYRDKTKFEVRNDGAPVLLQKPDWPDAQLFEDEYFGEQAVYFETVELSVALERAQAEAQSIELIVHFMGCQEGGICYPPMSRSFDLNLPGGAQISPIAASFAAASQSGAADLAAPESLIKMLLFAVLGGLILNLMPCVLPILSLKVFSLTSSGESAAKARKHALWYTAGVLLSFAAIGLLVVGLRSAGMALGWGFQLQQPIVVGLLGMLMFAIGLSLSGVFQIGAGITNIGQGLASKTGPAGDFFTGVLAVVVAAPCTAPLMGAALAFAFGAPALTALLIFVALGFGLALPFLLIGFVPALARRLPKPGAWMDTFKGLLAFPMYLTAIWLFWVLANQRGADGIGLALFAATILALGLWLWEHYRHHRRAWPRRVGLLIAVLSLLPIWSIHQMPAPQSVAAADGSSVLYSAEALQTLRNEKRLVFVNMTADWCVSCKANERTVLGTDSFRDLIERYDAVYMKGDWTNPDPRIEAFLAEHKAVGIPLYVVYPVNGSAPLILPTLLTQGIVADAMAQAADER